MVEIRSADSEIPMRVEVGSVVRTPKRFHISAREVQRAAIARRIGVVRIDRFEAAIAVRRTPVDLIQLQGSLSADVVQECVITLDPIGARIQVEIDNYYSEFPREMPSGTDDLALGDENWPELVEDGWIDLGDAVIQELAVAIDPYPRKPDVELGVVEFENGAADTHRPFSGLVDINTKRAGPESER